MHRHDARKNTDAVVRYHRNVSNEYFVVECEANQQHWKFEQLIGQCADRLDTYIGEPVTVHYDPNNPEQAFAGTPGKSRHPS